jgi:hypothetical protein
LAFAQRMHSPARTGSNGPGRTPRAGTTRPSERMTPAPSRWHTMQRNVAGRLAFIGGSPWIVSTQKVGRCGDPIF